MAVPERLVGSVLASGHRLLRVVGEGGMGAVFEAEDGNGARLAVKILRSERCDPEELERFFREGRVGRRITGPHVIPVLSSGIDRELGCRYLVMPFIQGDDLEAVLRQTGPLEPHVALRIAIEAARGLSAVHAQGIVHRDVKPSNVLLEHAEGGRIVARLCDFGISKSMDTEAVLTGSATMLGSPLYMSPEHLHGAKTIEFRSDVYGLGATLYEMLVGQAPFAPLEKSLFDLFIAIGTRECPRVESSAPWVPSALADVVARALRRDLGERFPSADALLGALEAIANDDRGLTISDLRSARPRTSAAAVTMEAASNDTGGGAERLDRFVGRTLDGRYRVIRRLGQGGMGAVYEAESEAGGRVAIKVIDAQDSPRDDRAIRRFLREARAATEIRSQHAVRVFELGHDRSFGVPFIVMELLDGTDLAALVAAKGPLDSGIASRLFLQAARGLAAAHRVGIVHRDIKPANLFLHRQRGSQGADEIVVKVCDFGIAKRIVDGVEGASADLTRTGGVLGSPIYMSPEQAKGSKSLDARSDIWSLCMSMHEALSGRRPWEGLSALGEIIVAICTNPVPSLADVAPWIDRGLAQVVDRGLAARPEARWQTVDELIAALEPIARGANVTAAELAHVEPRKRAAVRHVASAIADDASMSGATSTAIRPARAIGRRRVFAALVVGLAVGLAGASVARFGRVPGTGAAPVTSVDPDRTQAATASAATAEPGVDVASSATTTPFAAPSSASATVATEIDRRPGSAAAGAATARPATRAAKPTATGEHGAGAAAPVAPAEGTSPGGVRPKETW